MSTLSLCCRDEHTLTEHAPFHTRFRGAAHCWEQLWRCLSCGSIRVYGATTSRDPSFVAGDEDIELTGDYRHPMADADERVFGITRRDLGLPEITEE